MKEKLHSSHIGSEGCLRRARECLFWPNMADEIKDYVGLCATCRKYEFGNPNETLMSHEVPDRPWAKIGADLSSLLGKNYLITVDYMSNFWEVDFLKDTEAATVVKKLKMHCALYGIPDQILSDNGPQFASKSFVQFANEWGIIHTPSSPGNSKGNGKAKSAN